MPSRPRFNFYPLIHSLLQNNGIDRDARKKEWIPRDFICRKCTNFDRPIIVVLTVTAPSTWTNYCTQRLHFFFCIPLFLPSFRHKFLCFIFHSAFIARENNCNLFIVYSGVCVRQRILVFFAVQIVRCNKCQHFLMNVLLRGCKCVVAVRQRPNKLCACYEREPTAKWIIIAANNLLKMNTKNKWMKKKRGKISENKKKTLAGKLRMRASERPREKESQRGIMTKHVQLLFGPFVLHFMLDLDYTLRLQHVIDWTSTASPRRHTQINALAQPTNAFRHFRCACTESNHHKPGYVRPFFRCRIVISIWLVCNMQLYVLICNKISIKPHSFRWLDRVCIVSESLSVLFSGKEMAMTQKWTAACATHTHTRQVESRT